MNANITTARICGLQGRIYYHRIMGTYVWNVTLNEAFTSIQSHFILRAGDNMKEAEEYQKKLNKELEEIQIFNANKVAILFDNTGTISAIAPIGQDVWISIKDKKMVKKSFGDYNITSLKVY